MLGGFVFMATPYTHIISEECMQLSRFFMTYSLAEGVTTCVSSWNVPPVLLLLVDERVPSLEVGRVLEQRLILVLDDIAHDLLLDHGLAPVVIEPVVFDFLSVGVCEEKRVSYSACNLSRVVYCPTESIIDLFLRQKLEKRRKRLPSTPASVLRDCSTLN